MAKLQISRQQAKAGQFPRVCICCGQPAQRMVKHKFQYQPTWYVILRFILPRILYWILGSRSVTLNVPVCGKHAHRLKLPTYGGYALAALLLLGVFASLGLQFAGQSTAGGTVVLILVAIMLPCLIGLMVLQIMTPRAEKIDGNLVVLTGVSPQFAGQQSYGGGAPSGAGMGQAAMGGPLGFGAQPGFGQQPGFGGQPGFGAQPGFGQQFQTPHGAAAGSGKNTALIWTLVGVGSAVFLAVVIGIVVLVASMSGDSKRDVAESEPGGATGPDNPASSKSGGSDRETSTRDKLSPIVKELNSNDTDRIESAIHDLVFLHDLAPNREVADALAGVIESGRLRSESEIADGIAVDELTHWVTPDHLPLLNELHASKRYGNTSNLKKTIRRLEKEAPTMASVDERNERAEAGKENTREPATLEEKRARWMADLRSGNVAREHGALIQLTNAKESEADAELTTTLVGFLEKGSTFTNLVIEALEKWGTADALPPLRQIVDDPSSTVFDKRGAGLAVQVIERRSGLGPQLGEPVPANHQLQVGDQVFVEYLGDWVLGKVVEVSGGGFYQVDVGGVAAGQRAYPAFHRQLRFPK